MSLLLDAYSSYIFDLDGTLANTAGDVMASMRAALVQNGLPDGDVTTDLIGPPLPEMYRMILGDVPEDLLGKLVQDYRKVYNASGTPLTTLFPGIPAVLQHLQARGARLFVATNKSCISTFPLLERLGIRNVFAGIMCPDALIDTLGREVSKFEMIRHILAHWDIDPMQSIMAGDSVPDVTSGISAGVHTLGVLYGYGRKDAILAAGPEWAVSDPAWAHVVRCRAVRP